MALVTCGMFLAKVKHIGADLCIGANMDNITIRKQARMTLRQDQGRTEIT
jgi:hypothetical protein